MVQFLTSNGWDVNLATAVAIILGVVACSSFGLIWVIFGIWLERKVAGRIQDRVGPNRTGPFGLFQTFADIGKLLIKEDITPAGADRHVYNIAPLLALGSILLIWAVIPFSAEWIGADVNIGALYFTAVGSFATLAILLAGWGSNNKYALLGAFRVVAQLISYEVPMIMAILVPVLLAGTMSMQGIVYGQNIMYLLVVPISALIFFISSLAEVGRAPFDLLEAESEIIAGFNIEYSGMKFAMFYAAEFLHAFTICALTAVLFMGGWRGPGADIGGIAGSLLGFGYLFAKTMFWYFVVMLVRNTVPRLRIDHMMAFNWKFLVPLSLINFLIVALVAKLFTPDYAAALNAVNGGGFYGLVGGIFGYGFVAEFWRGVFLIAANIGMFLVGSRILRTYVQLDQRKVRPSIEPRRAVPQSLANKEVSASAGD